MASRNTTVTSASRLTRSRLPPASVTSVPADEQRADDQTAEQQADPRAPPAGVDLGEDTRDDVLVGDAVEDAGCVTRVTRVVLVMATSAMMVKIVCHEVGGEGEDTLA